MLLDEVIKAKFLHDHQHKCNVSSLENVCKMNESKGQNLDASKKWLSNQSTSDIEKLLPVRESNSLSSSSTSSVSVKKNQHFDIYCLNRSLDLDSLDDEEFDDLEYVFESSSSSHNDEPDKLSSINKLDRDDNIKEEEIEADFTEITQQTNLKLGKLANESIQVENDFKTESTDWLDPDNIGREYSEWYQGGPSDLSCKSCGKISLNDSTLSDITEISDLNLSEYEGVDLSEINSPKKQKESLLQNLKQLSAKAKLIYEHLNGRIELLKEDKTSLESSSKYELKTKKKIFEQFIFAPVPISKEHSTQKLNASFASNETSSLDTNSISKKHNTKNSNKLKMPFKYFSSNIIEATKKLFPFRNNSNTKLPTPPPSPPPSPPQTFTHYSDTFSTNKITSTIFDSTHTLEDNEQVKIEVNHYLRQKYLSKKEPISFNIKISITY
jgi:hypothetical protein